MIRPYPIIRSTSAMEQYREPLVLVAGCPSTRTPSLVLRTTSSGVVQMD